MEHGTLRHVTHSLYHVMLMPCYMAVTSDEKLKKIDFKSQNTASDSASKVHNSHPCHMIHMVM